MLILTYSIDTCDHLVIKFCRSFSPVLLDTIEQEVVPLVHLKVVHLLLDAFNPVHQVLSKK